jgi:hypothetical protein
MKPIKKANDLVNKMYMCDDPEGNYPMCFASAIQCALIAADETLIALHYNVWTNVDEINYWKEVKEELEYMHTKHLPK